MLFDAKERAQIEQAVAEVEAVSAAEIVVAVIERAADYAALRALLSAIAVFAISSGLDVWMPTAVQTLARIDLLSLQLVVGISFWFAFGWSPLLRRWLPKQLAEAAAKEKALAMFTARSVYRTRDASGILLMLVADERQAILLADHGVHARLGSAGWDRYLEPILDGLRHRRGAPAVCEQLRVLQGLLATHFPRSAEDRNELPNQVR